MKSKAFDFIRLLPSYKLKAILIRVPLVALLGVLLLLLSASFARVDYSGFKFVDFIKVAVIFVMLEEINIFISHLVDRFYTTRNKIRLTILFNLIINTLFGWLAISFFEKTEGLIISENPIVRLMVFFGILFVFVLILISIAIKVMGQWIDDQEELEELKRAKIKSDYKALQDQLNPHFLFNNLSVLKSMIQYEPEGAVEFTQNFTDVYRYVLQSKEKNIVSLKEELEYMESYIGIHKKRLGDGLEIKINVDSILHDHSIPPLSLQLLVENAIKHNISSRNKPLQIEIFTSEESITVKNRLQLKESSYSTAMGLKNLIKRYSLLSNREVIIDQKDSYFAVTLPLIRK